MSSRVEAIQDAARGNAAVMTALSLLDDGEGESLVASPALSKTLGAQLAGLNGDELLSAALGLAELAFVLTEKNSAPDAAKVVLDTVAAQQSRIDAALEQLGGDAAALGKLKQLKKDAFGAQAAADKSAALGAGRGEHVSNAGFDLGSPSPRKK